MNEKELLYARIEDKIAACERDYSPTYTSFFDAPTAALASSAATGRKARFSLEGGYEGAERKLLIFLPEYAETVFDCYSPDDHPICVFRVKNKNPEKELTHRDYLGALMALGIKRETLGDILVFPDGADILALRSVSDFLLSECTKIGNAPVRGEIVPVSEVRLPQVNVKEIRAFVASPRLDAVIASAFSVSRSDAVSAISQGIVFVDDVPVQKPDYTVREGAKLVLRGKGKAVLRSFAGESKKGRTILVLNRYI